MRAQARPSGDRRPEIGVDTVQVDFHFVEASLHIGTQVLDFGTYVLNLGAYVLDLGTQIPGVAAVKRMPARMATSGTPTMRRSCLAVYDASTRA